ncbi:hypothetical protein MPL1032_110002 [Mesorhizobium plurifarium]|uniref:Uncharacterized protein n=1 Tax=Mesorhizobium plurifarium TaxID=69974 RepID=A0A0K2VPU6_MESPL|nr:hypothetical protein MPL1032_110002 [Mesorhizobium plurifarium]
MATRNSTSASGWISDTAMRAKKNEPPQIAPSRRSCVQSLSVIGPRVGTAPAIVDMSCSSPGRSQPVNISPTDIEFGGKDHPKPDCWFSVGKMCDRPLRVARHRTVFFGG